MKRWAKWTILASILVLASGIAAKVTLADSYRGFRYAHWKRGDRHRGPGFGRILSHMKQRLDLSDEQVGKIQDIMTESRKKGIKVRADLRVARIELGQLLAQKEVNKTAVDRKVSQIEETGKQLFRHWINSFFQVREVLTPEQREKAKPFIQRILSGHRGRFQKRGGRGGRHGDL